MFRVVMLGYLLIGASYVSCCIEASQKEIRIEVGESKTWIATVSNLSSSVIELIPEHPNIIYVASALSSMNIMEINVTGLAAGKSEISAICGEQFKSDTEHFVLHVQVHSSKTLDFISVIFGWLYFLAWSICFYPQVCDNYKTKSVVGLNFDGVLFAVLGFGLYNIFNVSMTFVPIIKKQYSQRYPNGISPVLTNDLVFSIHGLAINCVVVYQCLIFYRGKQKISTSAFVALLICSLVVGSSVVLTFLDIISWLDVVYLCSYIKMYGSIMTYIPQIYMNYKRKSTTGYSIGGIIIDICGSIFCSIQMSLDGYNYDDWKTYLENPTKFGLIFISIGVSITLIVQHYILYRKPSQKDNELQCHG